MECACPCTICKETDHHPSNCPELVKDLQPGFYKPAGGYAQGGDEEDEKIQIKSKQTRTQMKTNIIPV